MTDGDHIVTFNVRDFISLAKAYVASGKHHVGIIISDHLAFRDLLRRMLTLLFEHSKAADLADQLIWLQDYKEPNN